MRCFELLGKVLPDAYRAIDAHSDAIRDEMILAQIKYLYDSYDQLNSGPILDYSKAATRFAYLYEYAGIRADFVSQIASRNRVLRDLLSGQQVRIACIGGGPGTELIGLAKYATCQRQCANISACIFDKESNWCQSWAIVSRHLVPFLHARHNIGATWATFDAMNSSTWPQSSQLRDYDLFVMSYFVAELRARQSGATPFMHHVLGNAKPNALFVFLNNDYPVDCHWFGNLANSYGWIDINAPADAVQLTLSANEQVKDLDPFFTKYWVNRVEVEGRWHPQKYLNTAYRVYRRDRASAIPKPDDDIPW